MVAIARKRTPSRLNRALADIAEGIRHNHVWVLLGTHDIKQRYRRSSLGPFWLTLSTAILIATMGALYARLFNQAPSDYLPFLAAGLLLWTFISNCIGDLCSAFIAAESLIKQMKLPLTVHIARVIWRNLLIFAHNAIILLPVALYAGKATVLGVMTSIAGVCMIAATAVFVGLILGIVCTRFRDVPQIIASLMQIAFFMTPIMWRPEVLGDKIWVAKINPFFHYVEIVRSPLVSGPIPVASWIFVLGSSVMIGLCALPMLAKYGRRVPYWV